MTNYEIEYQRNANACGKVSDEIVDFFTRYEKKKAKILDLGCGQGRDALLMAAKGHNVLGIDMAPAGIKQMLKKARRKKLKVRGVVADIREYPIESEYDVIVLDRVIHMLKSTRQKSLLLERTARAVRDGGYILIADTPANNIIVEEFFASLEKWNRVYNNKGFRFFQKVI